MDRVSRSQCNMQISYEIICNAHVLQLCLVFTSDGFGVGVIVGVMKELMTQRKSKIGVVSRVISPTESESEESERFHSFRLRLRLRVYDSVAYDPVTTRLSESEAEAQELTNCKPGIKHCHWFILPLLLATGLLSFRPSSCVRCPALSLWNRVA